MHVVFPILYKSFFKATPVIVVVKVPYVFILVQFHITTYPRVLVLKVRLTSFEYYNQIKFAHPLIALRQISIFVDQEEFLLCLESLFLLVLRIVSEASTPNVIIFKPGVRSLWPRAPGFLKLLWLVRRYVCMCVCPPPRPLITSGVVWCDTGRVRLVKQALRLFPTFNYCI